MRLGINSNIPAASPKEWAQLLRELGCGAAVCPVTVSDPEDLKQEYRRWMEHYDIRLGEVGVWNNMMSADPKEARQNIQKNIEALAMAEELGACCCVNIAGTPAEIWDTYDPRNYGEDYYMQLVDTVREIIDAVNPKRTFYTLEPMPWMLPDSPESYLRLIQDVGRDKFGVHLDYCNMINGVERYHNRQNFIEECFRLLGPYIKSVHVKDVRMDPRALPCSIRETLPGTGVIDLGRVCSLCEQLGPDTTVFVEHLSSWQDCVSAVEFLKEAARQQQIILK